MHHAEYRISVMHQADVDCELVCSLDELLGAIQRIHQPKPLVRSQADRFTFGRLFRNDGIPGVSSLSSAVINWCDALSASVSGELSAFTSIGISFPYSSSVFLPAAMAIWRTSSRRADGSNCIVLIFFGW